jgi:hypothetical protein
MGRKKNARRPMRVVIKLTLYPDQHQALIDAITQAPNKAQLVMDALENGKRITQAPAPDEDETTRDQLLSFVM